MKAFLLIPLLFVWTPARGETTAVPPLPKEELSIHDQIKAARAKQAADEKIAPSGRPWDRDADGKRPWDKQQPAK